jgi:hypothetical protein
VCDKKKSDNYSVRCVASKVEFLAEVLARTIDGQLFLRPNVVRLFIYSAASAPVMLTLTKHLIDSATLSWKISDNEAISICFIFDDLSPLS